MMAQLRADPAASEPLRQLALTLLERHREDPYQLNRASYSVARQPGADPARYQLALRQAKVAALAPPTWNFAPVYPPATVLGMAQYRLTQYHDAVESLTRADAEYQAQYKRGSAPWNLAFLAMAYHQLGRQKEAQDTLAQLHQVMKDSRWAYQGDHQRYVREAEALVRGAGQPAAPEE
jgi:hypothetical protein